jgi:hypothetical protein
MSPVDGVGMASTKLRIPFDAAGAELACLGDADDREAAKRVDAAAQAGFLGPARAVVYSNALLIAAMSSAILFCRRSSLYSE